MSESAARAWVAVGEHRRPTAAGSSNRHRLQPVRLPEQSDTGDLVPAPHPAATARARGLLAARLRAPDPRRGTVARAELVRRMLAVDDAGLIAVVAPAGYGKSTLLTQWSMS